MIKDKARYTLPLTKYGDVDNSFYPILNAALQGLQGKELEDYVEAHKTAKPSAVRTPKIVVIDNEEFDISSLSNAGQKAVIHYSKFGVPTEEANKNFASLRSPKTDGVVPSLSDESKPSLQDLFYGFTYKSQKIFKLDKHEKAIMKEAIEIYSYTNRDIADFFDVTIDSVAAMYKGMKK